MKIINLTQHPATPEQRAAGVVDLQGRLLENLREALTFTELPDEHDLYMRARQVADIFEEATLDFDWERPSHEWPVPLIGGMPALMPFLERILTQEYLRVCYAFSLRESVEEMQADGSVVKRNVFRHKGFITVNA